MLPCPLTAEELQARGEEIARVLGEQEALEVKLEGAKHAHKAAMSELEDRVRVLGALLAALDAEKGPEEREGFVYARAALLWVLGYSHAFNNAKPLGTRWKRVEKGEEKGEASDE